MRDVLRRLAEVQPSGLPVLSIYLDMRPQATGENPGVRSGLIILKDRLREIEKTLGPRGAPLDSVRTDTMRIQEYREREFPISTQGLALFACAGAGLFEVVEAGVPFENQVSASPMPDLFQLARLLDEQETTVVALVDTNTARLFVSRLGFFNEVDGPNDRDRRDYRKRSMGGWSQARYQRHIDKHRMDFAQEAAAEMERLVAAEGAVRLLLAGDEVAIPLLRDALSPDVAKLLQDDVLRVHIRAPRGDLQSEIAPLLAQVEAEDAHTVADRLLGAVQADGLGVIGVERTWTALEHGQADVLLLAPQAPVSADVRSQLIRLATNTGALVEVVESHTRFEELGGVGALLRYRHDPGAHEPLLTATTDGRGARMVRPTER
jgi:peptide subunit release factor 1 (eRF1)